MTAAPSTGETRNGIVEIKLGNLIIALTLFIANLGLFYLCIARKEPAATNVM